MDLGEFDESHAHDDGCHTLQRWGSRPRIYTGEPDHGSSYSYEQHFASADAATLTEDDDSVFGAPRSRGASHPASSNSLKQIVSAMKERIEALERQLGSTQSNGGCEGSVDEMLTSSSQRDAKVTFESAPPKESVHEPQMNVQLVEKPWVEFMNKISGEQEYAIEVLVGEPDYYHHAKDADKNDKKPSSKNGHRVDRESKTPRKGREGASVPDRIRINSPVILNILADIDSHIDATASLIMLRPFKFLVHYEEKIKGIVQKLRTQLNEAEFNTTVSRCAESPTAQTPSTFSPIPSDNDSRRVTLQHMECLTDFIDRYLRPTLDRLSNNSDGKIQFRDLWYIFRPGVDIYMPLRLFRGPVSIDAVMATPEMFQTRYNVMWRVTGIGGGRPNLSTSRTRNANHEPNPFKAHCYYIDFDGKFFCAIAHTFSIMPFKGERDITSLEFFPARFLQDAENTITNHLDKGKKIFDNIASSFTHYYYAGPTLVAQPCGCPVQSDHVQQEHVESEVIVDFRMALLKKPNWRPKPFSWKPPPVERRELLERYQLRYYLDLERTRLESSERDQVHDDYHIDLEEAITFKNKESIFAPVPSGWLSNASMVPEDDVLLLPSRVFAFVLRTRTFAPLWLHLLQPIKPQTDGLRNLQLRDESFKDTVQALVRTHFIQKESQKSAEFEYDVVRGKGKGLVILLHGAPGVGKSYTAESVAAANGKPLFQITCGDLGMTPEEVDRSLKEIFRLAQLWNCVLLLDECDIFLTQRSQEDIHRNSLVSVFLKVLEFYTGVLFLTTNRVGVLDGAIRSRITWSAYYPPLDWQQTKNIWKVNLKLLEERNKRLLIDKDRIKKFARDHYRSSLRSESTWNGRQIQNAFKVAAALAEWDALSSDVQQDIDTRLAEEDMTVRPELTDTHFLTVAVGTEAFNKYLQEARGFNDRELAYNRMERADDFDPEDYGNDAASVISQQDHDRAHLPLISYPSSSGPRQRRTSSTVTSPKSFRQEIGSPTDHSRGQRRRASSQTQHQPMPSSSPGPSSRAVPVQKPQSPRSPKYQNPTASMDLQLQVPMNGRPSHGADRSRTTKTAAAAAAITVTPHHASLSSRASVNGMQRSPSNSGLARQEFDADNNDDERIDWTGSSEGDDAGGGQHENAVSDADMTDEDW